MLEHAEDQSYENEDPQAIPKMTVQQTLRYLYYLYTDSKGELGRLNNKFGNAVRTAGIMNVSKNGTVWLFGPDANQQVLMNSEGIYSSEKGWAAFLDAFFPGSVMAMDGEAHLKQRRIMSTAFKKPSLVEYLDKLNPQVDSCIDDWALEFPVYPSVKRLTLDIATKVLMGAEPGLNADRVNKAFIDAVEATTGVVRKDLPFTKYRKGIRGNQYLYKQFQKALPEKRKNLTPDFFSQFCHAESDEGERFTDDEIINHMIFLMMAAHDTSTSTICTLFYLLGKYPEWQQRLRDESQALGRDYMEFDDQKTLESLDWCIREALRLHPPLPFMPRAITKDFVFRGKQMKKGSVVFIAPLHTHFMEALWTEPEKFDPERFSPARKEQKSHPYAWIPFGGGAHMCIGQHFGLMEIKAIMHQVLLKFEWEIPVSYSMPYKYVPIGRPGGKFKVKLKPLNKA